MKEYIVQAFAQETIDSFDAHNAPELVRCRDCMWYKNFYCTNWNCPIGREPNWFCADGVKRDE